MDKASIVRTVVLIVVLINQVLVSAGKSPIPYSDSEIEFAVTSVLTVGVSLWTWWKNNYISKKGIRQKILLKDNNLTK